MLFLEEQTLNWKSMAWRAFQKKIWRNGGGYLNKKLRKARKRSNKMILMNTKMMNLQLQLHFSPNKFSRSRGTFPQWHNQVCLLCQVRQGCLLVYHH